MRNENDASQNVTIDADGGLLRRAWSFSLQCRNVTRPFLQLASLIGQ